MKRLYRLEQSKKIAGICAGVGDQYQVDPNIIRLALVFICVATFVWPTIVAYLVGWFLIPEKEEVPESPTEMP